MQGTIGVFANKVARAGSCLDQPTVLQQVVSLEDCGRADPVSATGMPHGRHFLTRTEYAAVDQLGNIVGEFLVAFHPVQVHRRKGYGQTLYGVGGGHGSAS